MLHDYSTMITYDTIIVVMTSVMSLLSVTRTALVYYK